MSSQNPDAPMRHLIIGFVGQGFVGKNYADDFERRGYNIVRYSLEEEFAKNKENIKECDIVFIATPTPTTPEGFGFDSVREALGLVGEGKIAVVKSTILPGTTITLQSENPNIFVLHSPEFLSEATAAHDAAFPDRNIIGIPKDEPAWREAAETVLSVLPSAPYSSICGSTEAELIKYGRNTLGYVRIVFTNVLYDIAERLGANWQTVEQAMSADPDNGPTYSGVIHKSGRGAGGHCFIKDFAALRRFAEDLGTDSRDLAIMSALEDKNIELLRSARKDLDLLFGVYGESIEDMTSSNIAGVTPAALKAKHQASSSHADSSSPPLPKKSFSQRSLAT